jgi:hypothetical protein
MTKRLKLSRETLKKLSRAIPLRAGPPSDGSCLPKVACPERVSDECPTYRGEDSCAQTCECTYDCTGWLCDD